MAMTDSVLDYNPNISRLSGLQQSGVRRVHTEKVRKCASDKGNWGSGFRKLIPGDDQTLIGQLRFDDANDEEAFAWITQGNNSWLVPIEDTDESLRLDLLLEQFPERTLEGYFALTTGMRLKV